uniref:Headcase N-terminal domain-containing protein n=1 Tax=Onchocerca volvulus TaxID=6282 RepID=A0A2K6WEG9_ONCVO
MGSSRRSPNGINNATRKPGCPIPLSSGCLRGFPIPSSLEEGIKMKCSNNQCPYQDQLMHLQCFRALEDNLVKIMSNMGSARGWTDAQRRSNLWDKKGLSLIQRKCRCLCGLGLMRLDQTALFLANQNATQLSTAPPKTKKGKKNLPKLNFGSTNVATTQNDKQCIKYGNKKRNTFYRSISPSDSILSASSSIAKYSYDSERRVLSHTLFRGKWNPEIRTTKSEHGWTQKKSINSEPVMERKSFTSKKVSRNISYAEVTLMKRNDTGFMYSEDQFPKSEHVKSGIRPLSACGPFNNLRMQNFNVTQNHPVIYSTDLSTNTSVVSLPYEDFPNSLHSVSSDDTSESMSYYHFDANGFFVTPVDFSTILPSPSETPPGSLSSTDDSQTMSQKNDDVLQDVDNESTGYYSLFAGYSFGLGEILIADSYLPGLL